MVAIVAAAKGRLSADHIAVGCFKGEAPEASRQREAVVDALERLAGRSGWRGHWSQRMETQLAASGRGKPTVVSLWGLGSREHFDLSRLRQWTTLVSRQARLNGATRLGFEVPAHAETIGPSGAERLARMLLLSEYRYDRFRKFEELEERRLAKIQLAPPAGEEAAYRAVLPRARVVAEAVSLARDLANCPASLATPEWLAGHCRELVADLGFRIQELGPEELEAKGMEGILAVGRASSHPPRLLRLDWGGEGPVLALVGKGVTFDTGGLSLKTSAGMVDMKYDKAGACALFAAARAVAQLQLPVRLRLYLPLAENMPGGAAYRPSDVLRCYNGKTVEILNTDAEGRLLLADAMAWAVEEEPDALLEYSTLTGGAMVALGPHGAALYSPDDRLAAELETAAAASGERLWRMPLWPEYAEEMKGTHADLRNSAGRWGSAGLAAGFLSHFVGGFERWAHLDIAGTAHLRSEGESAGAGATGYGVALAVEWIRRQVA